MKKGSQRQLRLMATPSTVGAWLDPCPQFFYSGEALSLELLLSVRPDTRADLMMQTAADRSFVTSSAERRRVRMPRAASRLSRHSS